MSEREPAGDHSADLADERCPRCAASKVAGEPCPCCLLALGLDAAAAAELPAGARLGRYVVVAPLGRGGMGEVYRGRDPLLDREVAIKVLAAGATTPEALARFAIEAKAVAALADAHIRQLYDFGVEAEQPYAVMELLEGESLRDVLCRGPLPVVTALDYAAQVALGLAAAHERGIVHRDLKPENVFVTARGEVKVLDFGLARLAIPRGTGEASTVAMPRALTAEGVLLGTLGYMAPEQVLGWPVDASADLFALGAVLYEMLTGRRAFDASSGIAALRQIVDDEPPSITALASDVPAALQVIVDQCLAKRPDARLQSARDLALMLRSLQGGSRAGRAATVSRAHPRLVVLPFVHMGPASRQHWSDGLADGVRGKLTALVELEVIARGTSMALRGTSKESRTIAAELDATHLLGATVEWQRPSRAGRVRIAPELVEIVAGGAPICRWQHTFEVASSDAAQVQAEIAVAVARALDLRVDTRAQARLGEQLSRDAGAYDAFLRAEQVADSLAATDAATLRRAIVLYEQAVALDPEFLIAWAQLGRASSLLYFNGRPDPAVGRRAEEAAERALRLQPERAEGHLAQGDHRRWVRKDPAAALDAYLQAWRRAPGAADHLAAVALAEQGLGRWQAAIETLRQAERLDPRSLSTFRRLGFGLLWLRRLDEARATIERGLALAPHNLTLLTYRAITLLAAGDLAAARASLRAVSDPRVRLALAAYVASYGESWLLDAADLELLQRLTPQAFDDDVAVWALALARARASQGDRAAAAALAAQATRALGDQLAAAPEDPLRLAMLGLALACEGRAAESIVAAERAVTTMPIARDAYVGPYLQHQLVEVLLLANERERAVAALAPLLALPYHLTAARLRVDPVFSSLRELPAFARLIG